MQRAYDYISAEAPPNAPEPRPPAVIVIDAGDIVRWLKKRVDPDNTMVTPECDCPECTRSRAEKVKYAN